MNPDESREIIAAPIIAEERDNTLSFDKKMLDILSKEESSSEEESETEAEPPASNSNPKSISEAAPDRVKSPAVLSNQEEASQNQMQVRSSEVQARQPFPDIRQQCFYSGSESETDSDSE